MKAVQQEIIDDINSGVLQNAVNKSAQACNDNAFTSGWWKNLKRGGIETDVNYKRIVNFLNQEGKSYLINDLNSLLPMNDDMTTNDRGIGDLFMLMVTEIAEGYEGYRKNEMDNHLPKYLMQDVEIADVFIRVCDYMGQRSRETGGKINFGQIVSEKLEYNMNRPDHKMENRLKDDGKKL